MHLRLNIVYQKACTFAIQNAGFSRVFKDFQSMEPDDSYFSCTYYWKLIIWDSWTNQKSGRLEDHKHFIMEVHNFLITLIHLFYML